MENQKIINLIDKIDTDSKHFATKKGYIINDENNTNYGINKDTVVIMQKHMFWLMVLLERLMLLMLLD